MSKPAEIVLGSAMVILVCVAVIQGRAEGLWHGSGAIVGALLILDGVKGLFRRAKS